MLPHPWFDEESYRDQRARLLSESTTIRADEYIGLTGYCPHVWITLPIAEIVHRTSHPGPVGERLLNRCRAVRLMLTRAWSQKFMGAYAGAYNKDDILVEPLPVDLVVDCGNPGRFAMVFVLNDEKLLIAEQREFDLGEYYWEDRALLRSALLA